MSKWSGVGPLALTLLLMACQDAFALVAGYVPDISQIDLLVKGSVTESTIYDTMDITIQLCQVHIDEIVYAKDPNRKREVVHFVRNIEVKGFRDATGVERTDYRFHLATRPLLAPGQTYYFPLKWSPELVAWICYDQGGDAWLCDDAGVKKAEETRAAISTKH